MTHKPTLQNTAREFAFLMPLPASPCPHRAMATAALANLLDGTPMQITQLRPHGFPLPIKRLPDNPDGTSTQYYRAIAVLEWVNDQVQKPPVVADHSAELAINIVAPTLPPLKAPK